MNGRITFRNDSGDPTLPPLTIEVPLPLKISIDNLISQLERRSFIQKAYPGFRIAHLHIRTPNYDEKNGNRWFIGWNNSNDPNDYPRLLEKEFYINYVMAERLDLILRQSPEEMCRFLDSGSIGIDMSKARKNTTNLSFKKLELDDQVRLIDFVATELRGANTRS